MEVNENKEIDMIIKAISSKTRRNIIIQLLEEDMTINSIANKNNISKQAASKQKNILLKSRVINERKSGRETYCRINPESINKLKEYINQLEKFWDKRLDNLKNIIEDE